MKVSSFVLNQTLPVSLVMLLCLQTIRPVDAQETPGSPAPIRHTDLSVYRGDDGTPKPIRTEADWAIRREQILAGMQQAMGPLPAPIANQNFDVQVVEDVRKGSVRRLTLTIQIEGEDRLPLDLYLPASLADSVDPQQLLSPK
ncbi:MAG: hypothetical protein U0996_22165, partial [Planctomycetaceae bacterium]